MTEPLLKTDEPSPVVEHNPLATSPFLLTADHYGRRVPRALGDLGVSASEMERHIAWDIGIAGVATRLADALGAALIAQRYSRLVIDCNRPLDSPTSIPAVSEATRVPGNENLGADDRERRRRAIFDPYHRRIKAVIDQRMQLKQPTILLAMHSFTPVYAGVKRPWHIGTLYEHDARLPHLLLGALRKESGLVVGDNEPYAVRGGSDHTIPVHGQARGLLHTGIEIRQDLIAEEAGQRAWAERLAAIFRTLEPRLIGLNASG